MNHGVTLANKIRNKYLFFISYFLTYCGLLIGSWKKHHFILITPNEWLHCLTSKVFREVIRFLTVGITVGVHMHTECLTRRHIVILCLKLPHRDRNGSGFFPFSFSLHLTHLHFHPHIKVFPAWLRRHTVISSYEPTFLKLRS